MSFASHADYERRSSPPPVMPTLAEIRDYQQARRHHAAFMAIRWLRTSVFPVLCQMGNYTITDGLVQIERKFRIGSVIDGRMAVTMAWREIKHKMPGFKIEKLELCSGSVDGLFVHLKLVEDTSGPRAER